MSAHIKTKLIFYTKISCAVLVECSYYVNVLRNKNEMFKPRDNSYKFRHTKPF